MSTWTSICSAVHSSPPSSPWSIEWTRCTRLASTPRIWVWKYDRLVHGDLADVVDVRLDGVEAVPGRAVGLVVADVAEQRVAGPAGGGEVRRSRSCARCSRPTRAPPACGTAPAGRGHASPGCHGALPPAAKRTASWCAMRRARALARRAQARASRRSARRGRRRSAAPVPRRAASARAPARRADAAPCRWTGRSR